MRLKSRLDRIEAKAAPEVVTLVRVLCVRAGESVSEARQRQKIVPPDDKVQEIVLRGVAPKEDTPL